MIRKIANAYADRVGVEPAQTEDHGTLVATRAAMRFSRLRRPKTKFSSYAYACISIGISRWCRDDGGGAITLRIRTLSEPSLSLDGDESKESEYKIPETNDSQIELAKNRELIGIVRSELTESEFQLIEKYAQGDVDPNNEDLKEALGKAKLALLGATK